jgi:hypothetical protein
MNKSCHHFGQHAIFDSYCKSSGWLIVIITIRIHVGVLL